MSPISLRGLMAPLFIAIGLTFGVINIRLDRPVLFWLALFFLFLALAFAPATRQLLGNTFKDGNA